MTAWHEDGLTVAFLARIGDVREDGCWLWTGRSSRDGYGRLTYKGRDVSAHRVAYELAKGPIPAGLVIDHLCRVPACCNADHLEAVTQRENLMRGLTIPAVNAAKTHCKNGHEFTPENTYRAPGRPGTRCCRTCQRETGRRVDKLPHRRANRTAAGPCSIEGCERDRFGRGWCQPHYRRWLQQGDPTAVAA